MLTIKNKWKWLIMDAGRACFATHKPVWDDQAESYYVPCTENGDHCYIDANFLNGLPRENFKDDRKNLYKKHHGCWVSVN